MNALSSYPLRASFRFPRFRLRIANPFAWLLRMQERQRRRDELLRLSDDQLRDVGLSREQVLAQARKPFWKA